MLTKLFSKKAVVIGSGILVAITVIAGVSLFTHKKEAYADTTPPSGALHGYAWSSTTGWISLNCAEGGVGGSNICATSNYEVYLTGVTGSIDSITSGYAWSSNVGWISFNASDVTSCGAGLAPGYFPGSGAALRQPANKFIAWARVISGTDTSGADGCISMSGPSPVYGVSYNPASAPVVMGALTLPGHAVTGYAWGSTNLGWIQFDYASFDDAATPPPTLTLQVHDAANPTPASLLTMTSSGGPATLTWDSTVVTSCSGTSNIADPLWDTSHPVSSTGFDITPLPANTGTTTNTYFYTITCTGGGSPISSGVEIDVLPPGAGPEPTVSFYFFEEMPDPMTGFVPITPTTSVTVSAGYPGVGIAWTTKNIQFNSCLIGSSTDPSFMTGPFPMPSSETSVPETDSFAVGNLFGSGPFDITQEYTLSGCLPMGETVPLPDQIIHVYMDTAPSVTLLVNGLSTITMPTSSALPSPMLTWTSSNVLSTCDATSIAVEADWTGANSQPSSSTGYVIDVPANTLPVPVTHTYKITCHPTDITLADVSSTVTVRVPAALPTTARVTLLVNGVPSITMASPSATPSPTLSWTSAGVGATCDAVSSPAESDWSGVGSQPSFGSAYTIAVAPNTLPTPVTHTYKIICHPTDLSPDVSSTATVTVPGTGSGGTSHGRPPWLEF